MSGRSVTSSKTVEAPRVCVITVAGVITDPDFYAAQELAEALASNFFPVSSDVRPMVESELQHFASTSASTVEGIDTGASVVVFYNDRHLIGDAKAFELWAQRAYQFGTTPDRAAHAATAAAAFQRWAAGRAILLGADGARTIADRFVYMDVAIEGEAAGRVVYELFSEVCPKASENFRRLCSGMNDAGDASLHYRGSLIHRIVKDGFIQGGDIVAGKGDAGRSAVGESGACFEDETFAMGHTVPGVLGMANCGPHTNASQFYVTLRPSPWLDASKVAFGRVVSGLLTLRACADLPHRNQRPAVEVRVLDSGILAL
jgi:peptidyl-prolyl cis-trans isomerase-like 6|tara:strand:- start:6171 stop:7118 length:948 start_codon:yes stop_codon:yes gene_type:complete